MIISAGARIHIALVDLGDATLRAFGGIGMAVKCPRTVIEARPSPTLEFEGFEVLDSNAINDVEQLLGRISAHAPKLELTLRLLECPPQHCGFGSKTTLLLAIATLISKFYNLKLTRHQIQRLSGRGGASGVGIHAFFDGGILIDVGHKRRPENSLMPSAAGTPSSVPPVILRTALPQQWDVVLLLPQDRKTFSSIDEREFFRKNTPIPTIEILNTIGAIYHGVVPALIEGNMEPFKEALQVINHLGFKQREIAVQSSSVSRVIESLNTHPNIAAGMSSLGPLVFGIIDNKNDSLKYISDIASEEMFDFLGCVEPDNAGYTCE